MEPHFRGAIRWHRQLDFSRDGAIRLWDSPSNMTNPVRILTGFASNENSQPQVERQLTL
jgi:hypothetical protein